MTCTWGLLQVLTDLNDPPSPIDPSWDRFGHQKRCRHSKLTPGQNTTNPLGRLQWNAIEKCDQVN